MIINVKVTPRARENKVTKISDLIYKIRVTAPPEKGRANEKVVELLAAHFDKPKSLIKIIAGFNFHEKLIEIQ